MTSPAPEGESFADLLAKTESGSPRRAQPRVGDRLDVTVSKIGKVAVFVTLDGDQEAYIERSELLAKDGKLAVDVGSRVTAKVAEVGGRSGAVRLSPLVIRAAEGEGDATQQAPAADQTVLVAGMRVKGAVTRVERYGVFVQIAGTHGRKGRGLLPASETGTPRNSDLNKLFPLNSELEAKILSVEEDGKIRLSVSALKLDEERREYETFAHGNGQPEKKPAPNEPPKPPPIGSFGALLLKAQKKRLGAGR